MYTGDITEHMDLPISIDERTPIPQSNTQSDFHPLEQSSTRNIARMTEENLPTIWYPTPQ